MQSLTVIQHNVNSWFNKTHELYNIYSKYNADIILINHTGYSTNIHLEHYTTYYSNKQELHYGGTAIAIKSYISHTVIDSFETDLLAVTVNTRQGPITIATDYIPPNAQFLHFIDYNFLIKRQNPVYIFADINARHRILGHSNSNRIGTSIHKLISQNKLQHLGPFFPTYMTHRSTTSPDMVFANNKHFHNIHLTPGPLTSSDHIPIIAKITANPIQIPIKPRRQFRKANWPAFKQDLENINIDIPDNATPNDIDKALDTWNTHVNAASDRHIPTLQYRVVPGVKSTETTRLLQQQHDDLYQHIALHGPNQLLINELTRLRREIRLEYQQIHNDTWANIISNIENTTDPEHFFKSIKRFQGNKKQEIPYIRDHHNNKIHEIDKKAELFKKHWQTIFKNDPSDPDFDLSNIHITEINIMRNRDHLSPYTNADITRLDAAFPPITPAELKLVITNTKQRAPGPTKITTLQLKHLPDNMIRLLTRIFNLTLSLGYFPSSLKHAHMIFIPKGNTSQHKVENYRPISLLDTHGKLLDKILNNRLYNHLSLQNKHNNRQHGFRRNRGTNTALSTIYEHISMNYHNNKHTNVVLRDVAKAFDRVWHAGLLHKILNLNLHTCFTKTLSSFLTNRTASISLQNYTGTPFKLESGVPQGACLSPTLYNFYTHDTPDPTQHSEYIAYADDITQIIAHQNNNYLKIYTERAITNINTFESKWQIKTNTSKFQLLAIKYRANNTITTRDTVIPYSRQAKVLGLTLGSKSLKHHVTIRKIATSDKLLKLQKFSALSTKTKLKLYKTLIQPALLYPTVPLNTLSRCQVARLQTVQNKALKFNTNTSNNTRISSQTLHEQLHLEPLNITIHKQAKKHGKA